VEQELLTLPEDLSSPLVFSGVRVAQSLVLCVCFVLFLLAIVMSVRLRFTDSDNPFGIFKLFLKKIKKIKTYIQLVTLVDDVKQQTIIQLTNRGS
jgi:hypothetical protein